MASMCRFSWRFFGSWDSQALNGSLWFQRQPTYSLFGSLFKSNKKTGGWKVTPFFSIPKTVAQKNYRQLTSFFDLFLRDVYTYLRTFFPIVECVHPWTNTPPTSLFHTFIRPLSPITHTHTHVRTYYYAHSLSCLYLTFSCFSSLVFFVWCWKEMIEDKTGKISRQGSWSAHGSSPTDFHWTVKNEERVETIINKINEKKKTLLPKKLVHRVSC
jgi:hypothetical protein